MNKIARFGLNLIPPKSYNVALTFHNISPDYFNWFEEVIEYLSEDYNFMNPNKIKKINNNKKTKNEILLTFDDGFKSNLIVAENILYPRKIKALFFITFGFIELKEEKALEFVRKNYYPNGIKNISNEIFDSLTLKDIQKLISLGNKIGAHTRNHSDFKKITENELFSEIITETDLFENKLNLSINYFAYPFGSPNFITKKSLKYVKKRYIKAFTNVRGGLNENQNNHLIFRQNISPGCPLWKVKAIINGKLDIFHLRKRILLKNSFFLK